MTKTNAELEKELASLEAKVKSMEHLSSVVDAKDREIAEIGRASCRERV